jgi:hypothetical protein
MVVDASVAIIGSSTPPSMALELHATSIGESFKVELPDITALEVGPKGAAFECSHQSARLPTKCHGGTFKHLVPCCRLPSKVVIDSP